MSQNDLMSDYVARLNNARLAKADSVLVKKTKLNAAVSKKLTSMGYIKGFDEDGVYDLRLELDTSKTFSIRRISTPGQRVYAKKGHFPKIIGGRGYVIVTTSKGVLTHVEANKEGQGGEVLFEIY
jgi:small subunit ribosomal protein S8